MNSPHLLYPSHTAPFYLPSPPPIQTSFSSQRADYSHARQHTGPELQLNGAGMSPYSLVTGFGGGLFGWGGGMGGPWVASPTQSLPPFSPLNNPKHTNNIYIQGLPATTTSDSLCALASAYGPVESYKAIMNPDGSGCKGYGFVLFENEEDARAAIIDLCARGFVAAFARQESFTSRLRRLEDAKSTNIYLSNLPVDMDEKGLEELFTPYAAMSLRILRTETGESRGVGFVRVQDRDVAYHFIDKLHNTTIAGCIYPLQVRFADSPGQKEFKRLVSAVSAQRSRRQHARSATYPIWEPLVLPQINYAAILPKVALTTSPTDSLGSPLQFPLPPQKQHMQGYYAPPFPEPAEQFAFPHVSQQQAKQPQQHPDFVPRSAPEMDALVETLSQGMRFHGAGWRTWDERS